jgi:hypothetical protein
MSNAFNKEEKVAFEQLLEGFRDYLVMSRTVSRYKTDQTMMERVGDVLWRPQPYIARSFDGMDQTGNFQAYTQLSVPATIGYKKSVPWIMDALELRDALQNNRLGDAAKQRLASDINVAVATVAAMQGTIVVTKSAAASAYGDVAAIETAMNRVGIPHGDRYLGLSTGDYNGLAGDLAGRQDIGARIATDAYRRSMVGMVAGFETLKLDYGIALPAAAGGGGITMSTLVGAANYWTPMATRTAGATGERSNIDNRYQQITVSTTANVVAGDCFTIATCNEVHHITKTDTGSLKTFRVISVDDGTHMTISPPIISAQGGTQAEEQYKNCIVNTPAANSALVFLNIRAAIANPFWVKDSIEILPGRYAVPENSGVGILRGSTENGIEITMTKQYDIDNMKTKYRVDTLFGVVNLQPEMSGIALFSQT